MLGSFSPIHAFYILIDIDRKMKDRASILCLIFIQHLREMKQGEFCENCTVSEKKLKRKMALSENSDLMYLNIPPQKKKYYREGDNW